MYWSSLSGSAASLAVAHQINSREGLVLTQQEAEAETIAREMAYFKPELAHRIVYIPDSETLPFDLEIPSASILSTRAYKLTQLVSGRIEAPIIVSSVRNAMRTLSGRDFWMDFVRLEPQRLLPSGFRQKLESWGYRAAFRTKSPGQFSLRGRVLDIYPVGVIVSGENVDHHAIRIRLDEKNNVVQILKLDPLTQESSGSYDACQIYPNRDYSLDSAIVEGFRKGAFDCHEDPRSTEVYKTISGGLGHPELAWWIAQSSVGSMDLLGLLNNPVVILSLGAREAISEFSDLVVRRHFDVREDQTRIVPDVDQAFLSADIFLVRVQACHPFEIVPPQSGGLDFGYVKSGMKRMASLQDSLRVLSDLIKSGGDTLFVIKSQVREKHVSVMTNMMGYRAVEVAGFDDFLSRISLPADHPRIFIGRGDLMLGHANEQRHYRLITEREIFGSVIESRLDDEISEHQRRVILQGLHEIEIGEPLVHAMYGVGRFAGFERFNMFGKPGMAEDVVKLAYAEDASAFVRIRDLDLVSRYSGGAPEKPPLSKLNDPNWLAGIRQAQDSAFSVAAELVRIQSVRERAVGITLKPADSHYDRFCEVFSYEETPDQIRAIHDVIADMTSGKPMDRLICGDVGFGKTEVAMRAAFMMAHQGYQVVVLAPTTILAEQHYHSFVSRFEETNIQITLANRNSLSIRDLAAIRDGASSIIVGTHRLLQNDIVFNNLGLIIVDEEHRFGVRQKEMLRTMRGNKHMLTLTATPIPRTLGMAISGIRDLSIIATPPARRLSVRTLVKEFSDAALRVAMTRELSRNGQIFYLHNRIETMDECVEHLSGLMKNARIGKIHGKMPELEMTRIMMAFRRHEFDILVSTTVIEIGIDVPNANTLIIEDADNLGLAQLHQLRGRVGRSSRQAYAYLMHAPDCSKTGMMRLEAMEKASNLGEGFMIARHDMEIRGIGEVLGEDQSGHVHNIGFALYMRLLEQAVKAFEKGSETVEKGILLNNVEMPISGQIPADFMEETGERLAWYQRLISSGDSDELSANLREMEDLYGYLPPEIEQLRTSIETHILLRNWGICKVEQVENAVIIHLHEDTPAETRITLGLAFRNIKSGESGKPTLILKGHTLDSMLKVLSSSRRI